MLTLLTIAGFDPSSGAGISADLMVFAANGLFGTACITALTVQSTLGVCSSHPVSAEILRATLDCLHADTPPSGIKIGMMATAANVAAIADYLEMVRSDVATHRIPIVLDPVLHASSGRELLDPEGLTLARKRLLPLVDWITPNLAELATLSGRPVLTREDMPVAGVLLQSQLSDNKESGLGIFATGGHLCPPDDLLLASGGEQCWFPGEHINTASTHGTGCALSSAFLSRLVLGDRPQGAAVAAKNYVTQALRSAVPHGHGPGPLNHLWPLKPTERP